MPSYPSNQRLLSESLLTGDNIFNLIRLHAWCIMLSLLSFSGIPISNSCENILLESRRTIPNQANVFWKKPCMEVIVRDKSTHLSFRVWKLLIKFCGVRLQRLFAFFNTSKFLTTLTIILPALFQPCLDKTRLNAFEICSKFLKM